MNAPRHPTPSKRAAQPPSKRSGHLGKSTPGLQATGWWAGTRRQSLTSRTRTSQASTCDASEVAGLTSEDRRSTTTAPTSRGCRSRSTAAVLRGRHPPTGVGQLRLCQLRYGPPASDRAQGGLQPLYTSANWQACSAWPATPALPLSSPHRSPRHRQARDHKDDPHLSFADDSLPCWQEHVPEPQGQEPPRHEDIARLKRPVFAHARWQCTGRHRLGLWVCGVGRLERVECPTSGDIPASAWSIRGLGRGGGDECGSLRCVQAGQAVSLTR